MFMIFPTLCIMKPFGYGLRFVYLKLAGAEISDEFRMFLYLGSGDIAVDDSALGHRPAVVARSVGDEEVRHDDVAGHLDEATCHEVGEGGVVDLVDLVEIIPAHSAC